MSNNIYISKMVINHVPFFNKVDRLVITGGGGSPEPVKYPNNEIHYKSVDNVVITPERNNSGDYLFKQNIISNQYVPALDHNVITFDDDVTYLPHDGFRKQDVVEFIWFPETVVEIGEGFLYECGKLERVNLKSFINVTRIKGSFLGKIAVDNPDLTGLENVEEIEGGFMVENSNLKVIDLTPICNAKKIGPYFLNENPNLKTIIIRRTDGVFPLLINSLWTQPDNIYVPDELVEEYKSQVNLQYTQYIKPLSQYTE